uniref:Uncharacterized protein n=1 Tax=Anguilla anguilla TaxID=7936 RepID=A0A0E9WCC1_ANGAN
MSEFSNLGMPACRPLGALRYEVKLFNCFIYSDFTYFLVKRPVKVSPDAKSVLCLCGTPIVITL